VTRLVHWRLREARAARYDYRRQTCGPSSFASVELRFEPSEAFSFERRCPWPQDLEAGEATGLDAAIVAGVLDALRPGDGQPYAADRVAVQLTALEHDTVGSSESAFYAAAWHATRQLREESGAWELALPS